MTYVPGHRRLWIFDFDGTLSRIVPNREDARLDAECERMLHFLNQSPWNRIAVISSRSLDDLAPRIPVPSVPLGGGSGLEWALPGGYRTRPDPAAEAHLAKNRAAVGALLEEFRSIPGVEVEDKGWSVAIHFGNARQRSFRKRAFLLQRLRDLSGIRVYRGHEVVEVPLVSGGNKAAGVRRLCQILEWDPVRDRILYAGDDENDATAMHWIQQQGGTAIVVGNRIADHGTGHAEGPAELASMVYSLTTGSAAGIRAFAQNAVYA